MPSEDPSAEHLAKLQAAAHIYPHVRDTLTAWGIAEDFANMPELHKGIRRWANAHVQIALEWSEGIKSITSQDKFGRAVDYFERLLEEENIPGIQHWIWHPYLLRFVYWMRLPEDWRDRGFTLEELKYLRRKFEIFWKNRRRQ
jgi:hypothetical protein